MWPPRAGTGALVAALVGRHNEAMRAAVLAELTRVQTLPLEAAVRAVIELIVTVTMFAFPVFIASMDPPFIGLPPQSGNATGYLSAHEPGTYASTFTIESGEGMTAMTCASSVSWTP